MCFTSTKGWKLPAFSAVVGVVRGDGGLMMELLVILTTYLHAGSGGGGGGSVIDFPVWSFFYRSLDGGDSFMVVCVFFFRVVACRGFAGPGEWFCSSRLVVVGRCAADSREPMAVFAYRVPPAAYQGWMSAPRVGKVMNGVLKIGCHCPVATIPEEEGKQ